MAKGLPITKPDYSLEIRYKKGVKVQVNPYVHIPGGYQEEWSEWMHKGKGYFENIKIVQLQIRMIAALYPHKEKEIRFTLRGVLCDFEGNPSGRTIRLT